MLLQICQGHTFRIEAVLVLVVFLYRTLRSYKMLHILRTKSRNWSMGGWGHICSWDQRLSTEYSRYCKCKIKSMKIINKTAIHVLIQVRELDLPLFFLEAPSFPSDPACPFFLHAHHLFCTASSFVLPVHYFLCPPGELPVNTFTHFLLLCSW